MPREIPKPVRPTVVDNSTTASLKACQSATRQQTDYSDVKLKTLAENVAKLYVPFALKNSNNIEDITIDNLSNDAYLFVDNNGQPSKVLITTVLKKEISWEDLSDDIKQQLQNATQLTPGAHITIQNGIISADIGVESINGKTGIVTLTADDINTYTKDIACTKQELATALAEIEVDGGRYEN